MKHLWIISSLLFMSVCEASPPPRTEDALDALRADRWAEAVTTLSAVVEANPQDGLAHYYLGVSEQALGHSEVALSELRAALSLGVDGSRRGMRRAHLALARELATTGDSDAAITQLEVAWAKWGFDDIQGVLTDEAFGDLNAEPRLRELAGLEELADAGDRDAQWRADIRYFKRLISAAHPAPFRLVGEESWNARADSLAASVGRLRDVEIIGELMQLAALIGDGHTAVYPPAEGNGAWHLLPFFPICLADGWYVAAAPSEHEEIVGARLLGAGDLPWEEVVRFTSQHLAADNAFTHRWLAAIGLQFAEVYALAGAAEDATAVTLSLQLASGARVSRSLPAGPISRDPNSRWSPESWLSAYEEAPIWLMAPDRPFHHRTLDVPGVIYSQINQTADSPDQTLGDYGRELRNFFEQTEGRALILDLRLNNGGDAYDLPPLINELIRIPGLEAPGALTVLTGPRTFSATGSLLGVLEKQIPHTRIGWPSGCRPVGYSSERHFRLPYSKLGGSVSWELRIDGRGTDDRRPFFVPDWIQWPSGDDLRAGRDPVLEAALQGLE